MLKRLASVGMEMEYQSTCADALKQNRRKKRQTRLKGARQLFFWKMPCFLFVWVVGRGNSLGKSCWLLGRPYVNFISKIELELELEQIQTQTTQKPVLRVEVGARALRNQTGRGGVQVRVQVVKNVCGSLLSISDIKAPPCAGWENPHK